MSAPPRVLFLAFDAMDRDLVLEWAAAGILPTFRSLLARSLHGPTHNPPGLLVGAVWPSFFTGVSAARHARFCYEQLVSGSYTVKRIYAADLKPAPFWIAVSQAGRRVAIVDVPKSPLDTRINGIQLSNWGTHDPDLGVTFATSPPPLAAEIEARFGADPVGDCNLIERSPGGFAAFARSLKRRIEAKTDICRDLLPRGDWDLFLAVFAESHCVGHQCWTLHDETHLSHDRALAQAVGDPLREIYVALDRALGELLLRAGPVKPVFVLTSHGMGPHYDGTFMLDDMLRRLDPPLTTPPAGLVSRARGFARRILHQAPPATRSARDEAERPRRRVFAVPNNDVYGGIRVNLIGREPRGRVQPGAEYDALFTELRRQMLEIENLDTGAPVVRDLIRVDRIYAGERLCELPDFYVDWNRDTPIARVSSPAFGVLEKTFIGVRTGDHRPEGFFWATGPGIVPGRRLETVSVMDFAPSVAARLGISLDDVDGVPIRGLA